MMMASRRPAAQRREQKLSSLCSNISLRLPHALLTPLNGILGFSALLRSDAATLSVEDTAEMADAIHSSARELHRVIQNYLTFARVELLSTNDREVEALRARRTIVTGSMLHTLANGIASGARRTQDVVVDVTEARVMISADYFRKIVEELLGNALKFSPAGSSVEVTASVDRGGFLMTVTDHGCGMTPEQIAGSSPLPDFNRYIESRGGAGLGLILARRLAEVHGGNLKICSDRTNGTTVNVRLPAVGT